MANSSEGLRFQGRAMRPRDDRHGLDGALPGAGGLRAWRRAWSKLLRWFRPSAVWQGRGRRRRERWAPV